jgi:hypothetical protein
VGRGLVRCTAAVGGLLLLLLLLLLVDVVLDAGW